MNHVAEFVKVLDWATPYLSSAYPTTSLPDSELRLAETTERSMQHYQRLFICLVEKNASLFLRNYCLVEKGSQ